MTKGKADSQAVQEATRIVADVAKEVVTEVLIHRHGELQGRVTAFAIFGGGGVPGLVGDALIVARLGLSENPAEAANEIVAEAATDALEKAAGEALTIGLAACGIEVATFVANIGAASALVFSSTKLGNGELPAGLRALGLQAGPTPAFPLPPAPRTDPDNPRPEHDPRGPERGPDGGPVPSPAPTPAPEPGPGKGPDDPGLPDPPEFRGPRIPHGPAPTPGDGPEAPEEPPPAPAAPPDHPTPPPPPEEPPPPPPPPPEDPPPPPPPPAPEPTPVPDDPDDPKPPIPFPTGRTGQLVHPPKYTDAGLKEQLKRDQQRGGGGET